MSIIIKLIFIGTAEFGVPVLETLMDDEKILLQVVTQPDRPRGRGKKILPPPIKKAIMGKKVAVFQPENINEIDFVRKLEALEPDIILVVAYGQILSEKVLNFPKIGCINIHGSLLPKYRGAAPINRAIIDGEKETGITFISMNSKVDDGDMIAKFKIDIFPDETFGELSKRLSDLSAKTITKVLCDFRNGKLSPIIQDRKQATYTKKMNKKDCEVDWKERSEKIYNQIRGTIPYPGAYTYYKGKKIKITQLRWISAEKKSTLSHAILPGTIIAIEKDGLMISTGDSGQIKIIQLIPAGGKEMSAGQFVNGYKIKIGNTFGE